MSIRVWAFFFFIGNFVSLYGYQISVATIFKDEDPYLKEWIEYHLMVGVDHFWLYNHENEIKEETYAILQPYIEKGIVELFKWPYRNGLIVDQRTSMTDALRRAKGTTEWLALIDTDEYILPSSNKTILECLNAHFSQASAVYMTWRNFGTGKITIPKGEPILCRLVACAPRGHGYENNGKTIFRVKDVDCEAISYIHHVPLKSSGVYFYGDGVSIPKTANGREPSLDGTSHHGYLRIHHYFLRDEWFFHNVKKPRLVQRGDTESMINEWYNDFLKDKDLTLVDYIIKYHPKKYKKIWKKFSIYGPGANLKGVQKRGLDKK